MRIIVILILAILISGTAICQNKCSYLIRTFSKEWKLDSLTKEGYRSKVFKTLRQSIADSISVKDLVKYLGKPAKIQKFYSGNTNKNYIEYEYFYWDSYTIPNEQPFERFYISFVFDETATFLQYIDDGMSCR
jgi:hypothetical protein